MKPKRHKSVGSPKIASRAGARPEPSVPSVPSPEPFMLLQWVHDQLVQLKTSMMVSMESAAYLATHGHFIHLWQNVDALAKLLVHRHREIRILIVRKVEGRSQEHAVRRLHKGHRRPCALCTITFLRQPSAKPERVRTRTRYKHDQRVRVEQLQRRVVLLQGVREQGSEGGQPRHKDRVYSSRIFQSYIPAVYRNRQTSFIGKKHDPRTG